MTFTRRLIITFCLAFTLPSLLVFADPDRPFIFNLGADPRTLDPGKATTVDSAIVLRAAFEGLTRPMPDGTVEPGVAERWDVSEDGKTYTFHLRDDAKWSNGDPVTAGDFVYSWRRTLDPAFGSEYAYALYVLEGAKAYNEGKGSAEDVAVKAIDDHTLQATLNGPAPWWPTFLDHATHLPVHPATTKADENWSRKAETYICNGPYRIATIKPKEMIVMEPNPHHRDAENLGLKHLHLRMIVDDSTALVEFRNGRIHAIMSSPPLADLQNLRDEGILKSLPALGTYMAVFNTKVAPFDNPKVREAMTLAVNRKRLTRILKTGVKPALAYVPFGISQADGTDFREAHGDFFEDGDMKNARKALAEAGYPGGEGLPPITYVYNTSDDHKTIGEYLQNSWKRIGIDVRLQNLEWKVVNENLHKGQFQLARYGWIGDYMDPQTFLDMWITGAGNNTAQWSNAEYDELIQQAIRESDPMKRMEHFAAAEEILMGEYVLCPIYFYVINYYETDEVEGIERSTTMNIRFDRARWKK